MKVVFPCCESLVARHLSTCDVYTPTGKPRPAKFPKYTYKGATVSSDQLYRWSLSRTWNEFPDQRRVCWIMLNPSTADASDDDATIRKCVRYAAGWGYTGIDVVNLFGWRATDPRELRGAPDPVGKDCDQFILQFAHRAALVVCGWGANARGVLGHKRRWRDHQVLEMLAAEEIRTHALKLTKDGHPQHPLYLRGDAKPFDYPTPAELCREALATRRR